MAVPLEIQFLPLSAAFAGTAVVLAGEEMALGPTARAIDERTRGALTKAARAASFTGKARSAIEVLAPTGIDAQRLILAGTGAAPKELDRLRLGGFAFAQISARKAESASIIAEPADLGGASADAFARKALFRMAVPRNQRLARHLPWTREAAS